MSFGAVASIVSSGAAGLLPKAQSDQQQRMVDKQNQAIKDQQSADAAAKSKAETDAANAANQQRVASKRAYQANVLALGGQRDATLGGSSVLGSGAPAGSPVTSSAVKAPAFFS